MCSSDLKACSVSVGVDHVASHGHLLIVSLQNQVGAMPALQQHLQLLDAPYFKHQAAVYKVVALVGYQEPPNPHYCAVEGLTSAEKGGGRVFLRDNACGGSVVPPASVASVWKLASIVCLMQATGKHRVPRVRPCPTLQPWSVAPQIGRAHV